jgi:hypothetical protein
MKDRTDSACPAFIELRVYQGRRTFTKKLQKRIAESQL